MDKRQPTPLSSPALPAEEVAERLRAHARLCRQVAHESRNQNIAGELSRLADQCVEVADKIEPEAGSPLH